MASESVAGPLPPGLARAVTGAGAVTPVVRVSGRFIQDLSARPGDPRAFVTVGGYVAAVRRQLLAEIDAFEEVLADREVLATFPFLISDMRNAVARAGIHGADGKHVPSGTSGAALADLIGDRDEIYICVDDH